VVIGKVVVHLCVTLIIKELKIIVEHDRVVTTLNITLFKPIAMLCGTDSIMRNILSFSLNVRNIM
jgi:hypothetical protein